MTTAERPARRRALGSFALVFVVVVAGTYALEGVLAWRAYRPPDRSAQPDFDLRTPLEVVRDLRASGVAAVPALLPSYVAKVGSLDALVPLCGMPEAYAVFCNESGEYVVYESDEHGFNNPRDIEGPVEIVVLGDSFAHGQCVEPGEDLAGRLRAGGRMAVNLGCAGTGPLIQLATLAEYGTVLEPKTIIWLFFEGNDEADLDDEMKNPRWRRYLDGGAHQSLRQRPGDVKRLWERYLESNSDPSTKHFADPKVIAKRILELHHLRTILGLRGAARIDALEALDSVLSRGKALAEQSGARLVFVHMPAWPRVDGEMIPDRRALVLDVAAKHGLPIVDFTRTVQEHPDPRSLYPNRGIGHFDADGYALLAETVLRCIDDLRPGATCG